MSVHVAKVVGELFAAVDLLQLNGILSVSEAHKESERICKRAAIKGVFIATTTPFGEPLHNEVRLHWAGARGHQINRVYPAYNLAPRTKARR